MKRMISTLLSASLLLGLASGCGKQDGDIKSTGEAPMGRYVEEQGEVLTNTIRSYDFKMQPDGSLTFFARTQLDEQEGASVYKKYTAPAAGGPITSEEVPRLNEFAPFGVRDMAQGADGTLYIIYSDEDYNAMVGRSVNGAPFEQVKLSDAAAPSTPSGAGASMGSISMGGVSGSVGMSGSDSAEAAPADSDKALVFTGSNTMSTKYASGIHPLEEGGFLVLYGDKGVSRYTAEGDLQAEYMGTAFSGGTAIHGNTLVIRGSEEKTMVGYDLTTNQQSATYTYDNLGMGSYVSMDGENLYLADATGIYRQAKGSTLWERLVDGELTSLVMPNLLVSGFVADGKGGFAALLGSSESIQLMRYSYSADTPTNPDTELTIFGLNENNTVRQAIGEFQRRNPNVRVNFRVGIDGEGAATAEDVIRTLNTELLAGKGPDLILLDGLHVDAYIEKGVLADITDFVAAQSGLMSNLTTAYQKDGKLYGVPSRFTLPVMMGGADDVADINSLQALVEKVMAEQGGENGFLRASDDLWSEDNVGMMMDFYNVSAPHFLQTGGTIDQAALAQFLTAMTQLDKTMKEHTPQSDGSSAFVTMAISASGGGAGFERINMGPSDLKSGRARFHTQEMEGAFALSFISQNLGAMENQRLSTLFGGSAYTPKGGVGLNAAGKQQDLAKSFMEMLLSPTVQNSYLYDGYPINEGSLEALTIKTLEGMGDMGFLDLCKGLDTPLLTDQVIRDAVQSQIPDLMSGTITPEQAAAKVVEKTQIYLSE